MPEWCSWGLLSIFMTYTLFQYKDDLLWMDGYLATHTERSTARSIQRVDIVPVAHTPQNNGVWQISALKFCTECLAWQGATRDP